MDKTNIFPPKHSGFTQSYVLVIDMHRWHVDQANISSLLDWQDGLINMDK